MSEHINPRPERPDDEIDAGLFVRRLAHVFTATGDGISWTINAMLRRVVLIASFFVIGTGVGFLYYLLSPRVHKANMTLISHVLSNDYCAERLSNLQKLVNDQTPNLLATTLKLDVEKAHKIVSISYRHSYEPKPRQRDSIISGIPFMVKVGVLDPNILPALQEAIIDYLEQTEYSQDRKKIAREAMQKMLQKLEMEIEQLDSLKQIMASSLAKGNTGTVVISGQPSDPLNVYREDIALYKKKLDIEAELSLPDNIIVINGFFARDKPDHPKFLKSLVLGAGIFGLLGIIIALRKERRTLLPAKGR